ncbi:hypothetical protein PF66_04120 [Pseudomonas asplenii]|uniref:Uncharacterized protein n=1 Tax=Pseudomonas asplenii TaxID=53407 RepID=A0A0M9GEY4_9PSED|nr:hypothetical protein [Pseudomonas fuscovaginae]KPA89269.1 hypothetical protein PF66_04120 [Pseudomonas fuscovaginae]
MKAIRDLLLNLETERQRALVEQDHARLHEPFDDELLYVHTTGLVADQQRRSGATCTNLAQVPLRATCQAV